MTENIVVHEYEIDALKERVKILEKMVDIHEQDIKATGVIVKTIITNFYPDLEEAEA